jgi:squalene-associated FAD-dependent desaturase
LSDADAIVIGGGFAGLSAATALAEAGARVLVIEARPHLGGRATAYRDHVTGERIDNGQHVLAGCYDETLRFLRRIGRDSALRRPTTLDVALIGEDGSRLELSLPPLPPPLHLFAGVLAWRELSWSERLAVLRIGPVLQRLSKGSAAPPTGETVRQWLERHRQPARLCKLFWEPLALATLNQSIDQASAAPFLTVIGRMLASDGDAATILLPGTLLDELYAEPARTYLTDRGSVCKTGQLARVVFAGGKIHGVSVGDDVFAAPTIVSAVPWFALPNLLAGAPSSIDGTIANARALASSPIVTLNLWLDRPVLEDDFIGLPGRAFQWVFDKARILGGAFSHLSLVSSGAQAIVTLDNDAVRRMAVAELEQAVPAMRSAEIRRTSVVRERRATFSLSPSMPARPATVTPIAGLLLAGDWIDTGLPATIESAVVSGHAAARAALRNACYPS